MTVILHNYSVKHLLRETLKQRNFELEGYFVRDVESRAGQKICIDRYTCGAKKKGLINKLDF